MTDPAESPDAKPFDLEAFLPFLLNQTAEATSRAFQPAYREGFDLTRSQWRVLAITGRHGQITARDIVAIAHEEKSKISRAVAALEDRGLIERQTSQTDKRAEALSLTPLGETVRADIGRAGQAFEARIKTALGEDDAATLTDLLLRLRHAFETFA